MEPKAATAPVSIVRGRLIPALNPCWRLWLREEGPMQLVCLAQLGLELWSVQTDGRSLYFCHDRRVRRVHEESSEALRREIHTVRNGFVREFRIGLEEARFGQEVFGRTSNAPSRGGPVSVALAALAQAGVEPSTPPVPVDRSNVQVVYRRRRHAVAQPSDTALTA
jgi:hypothetical protein